MAIALLTVPIVAIDSSANRGHEEDEDACNSPAATFRWIGCC